MKIKINSCFVKIFQWRIFKKNKKSYKTLLKKISINIFLQFCIKYGFVFFVFVENFVWDGGFGYLEENPIFECVGKCQIEQRQKTIRTTKQVHL